MLQVATGNEVLSTLASITRTDEVCRNLDLELFDLGLLDSLGVVEMLVFITDRFGVEVSPAEIEREQWATPRLILEFLDTRLHR